MISQSNSAAYNTKSNSVELENLFGIDDATNRQLAKHPHSSGELLERLSHCSDKITRKNVASNPNSLPETLVRLAQQFPKEFLRNPAMDLILMVNPELIGKMPEALLVRLAKEKICPESLLVWTAKHPSAKVQLAVLMNPELPSKARSLLAKSEHDSVVKAIRSANQEINTHTPEETFKVAVKERLLTSGLDELHEAWKAGDIGLPQWRFLPQLFRLDIASRYKIHELLEKAPLPYDIFVQYSKNSHAGVRSLIAANKNVPADILENLAADMDINVRWCAFSNTSAPLQVRERLIIDKVFSKRNYAAKNPNSPAEVLWSLSKVDHSGIRSLVAENSGAPSDLLRVLASDKNKSVRCSVAKNSSCPSDVLALLAKDKDYLIQTEVAENKNTPADALEGMLVKVPVMIGALILSNPNVPDKFLEQYSRSKQGGVIEAVANNIKASVEFLERLAKKKNSTLSCRIILARHCHRSDFIFDKLRTDPHVEVRAAVRRYPVFSPDQINSLLSDARDEADLIDVLLNPVVDNESMLAGMKILFESLPEESPWFRLARSESDDKTKALLEGDSFLGFAGNNVNTAVLSKRPLAQLMAIASGLPIDPDRLVKVCSSTDWLVRAAVARNPSTPPNLVRRLSADAHPLAASLARSRL